MSVPSVERVHVLVQTSDSLCTNTPVSKGLKVQQMEKFPAQEAQMNAEDR